MDVITAIQTRRSIGLVKDEPIPKHLIEQILEAGTYAPNHYRTEPWRFFVLTDRARERLGDVFSEVVLSKEENPTSEEAIKKSERAKNNPLRAPVIIAVAVEPADKKNVLVIEEYGAVASAIQNMLLAAHSLDLGAIWRTGQLCYEEKVKDFFQLSERGELLAFIYIGYPNMSPPERTRTNYEQLTTWLAD